MIAGENREDWIFRQAQERASARRADFLDSACAGDLALRARIESRLAARPGAEASLGATVTVEEAVSTLPLEEAPGTLIGRYRLLEKIGEGGFGVVYAAEQKEPVKRRVALKVIKLGMDTRSVTARFEAERQALALMDHANIAKVHDAGATETGRPYFVMELVKGVAITRYCDENRLNTTQRLKLFIVVCQAIQHAHQKAIIHRDIKPSNILVADLGGAAIPKVIDFGIAKAVAGQTLTEKTLFTANEQFIGTPAYMSPEQAKFTALDIDTRSDIYSLGVLLYELLVGQTPFETKELLQAGLEEMRRWIWEQEPVRPSTRLGSLKEAQLTTAARQRGTEPSKLLGTVRGDLDWIVMRCLEKDRTRRYETANGLAMDLERYLKNEPVVARPPSIAYRVRKFVRRNRVAVGGAAALAGVVVLGAFLSTAEAVRAKRAEREQFRLRQAAQAAQASEAEQRRRVEEEVYVADMRLAGEMGEQNDVFRVRELLHDTAGYPERGFEWYYWQREAHLDALILRGHSDWVVCVAFSPNGKRIATGSPDSTARVWDAGSGKELLVFTGHSYGITSLAFSPDSRRLVTGSTDQTAKVWETETGKELLTLRGHTTTVTAVAFSPDGQRIAVGSADHIIKVWDVVGGTELLTLEGHSDTIQSVAFSPDGRRILTSSVDRTARIWDAASGKELMALKGHGAMLDSAEFSPDGERIVTASDDRTTRVWDAASGRELFRLPQGSERALFSPDGRRIAIASNPATLWDSASGKLLRTFAGHEDYLEYVDFSPDGKRIVTCGRDQTARVWDAEPHVLQGHSGSVRAAAFSPDGDRILTASADQTAKIWRSATGEELLTLRGHIAPIQCATFSSDGRRVATGSGDGTVRVWDASTGRAVLTLMTRNGFFVAVAYSPDNRRIAAGGLDGGVTLWDASGGSELLSLQGQRSPVRSVAFSPNGQRIVTGSDSGKARIWDAATGKELLGLAGHQSPIQAVAYSADGERIVTGSLDRMAKVWDAATGRELLTLKGHRDAVSSVAVSPNGQRIVTGSFDGTARIWETTHGKELLALKGHIGPIHSVAFSSDGQSIVTGGADQTAKLWLAAAPGQVTAWEQRQKAADERAEVLSREKAAADERERKQRVMDPGAIKEWLVLAPIPYSDGTREGAIEALDREQIPGEGALRARAGDRVKVGAVGLVWSPLRQEDYLFDFNRVLGELTHDSVAYALCYIRSEEAKTGLVVRVGSDDGCKVYLNGKEIERVPEPRSYVPDQDVVRGVDLKAGLNVLVFKVVQLFAGWQGSVRFTDSDGQPVQGISVTLDPGGPNRP